VTDLVSLSARSVSAAVGDATGGWILPTLVAVPLAGALLLLLVPRLGDRVATVFGGVVATVAAVLAVLVAIGAAPYHDVRTSLEVNHSWVPALGIRFHLGVDGISVPLVLLTALLGLLVSWHLVRVVPPGGRTRALAACVLAVEGGALATFVTLDLLLFFVAFEIVLIPMWFVVALWGDDTQKPRRIGRSAPLPGGEEARRDAAFRFILYTAFGSALMLLGIVLVGLKAHTTDLVLLAHGAGAALPTWVQTAAAFLIVIGLAVKTPMWPFHTWLPPAHSIAPTPGSVLLAGVLLKMGTYGMVRIALPVLPQGMHTVAPWLGAFAVVGILWGGLACLVEQDLKRLVAFSSVAHMGFVLLGIASATSIGVQGALFANVAHGLITGLLFLVAGAVKDRHHTADLVSLGSGLRDRLPRLGWLLAFGAFAGLGLPGLAGFWGELLAIAGTWQGHAALGWLAKPLAVAAVIGTVLASAYLLRVLRMVWHGPREPRWLGEGIRDAAPFEMAVATPLVLATVALGVVPALVLDMTGPAVRTMLTASTAAPAAAGATQHGTAQDAGGQP